MRKGFTMQLFSLCVCDVANCFADEEQEEGMRAHTNTLLEA